ncbi:MAG: polysaccharide pyruvyl transferase family protein, partial [Clostridia bacterium]|nr:polysaccharide pyruvyl transferase family protein [Clostridia bacterium]
MPNNLINRIRKLHGLLHEGRTQIKRQLNIRHELKNCSPDTFFLVGTPIHPNVGDSAIVVAEIAFLNKILPEGHKLFEITEYDFGIQRKLIIDTILKCAGRPVFWHGGGNMGDLWGKEESARRDAFTKLANRRIISFPQTIYYSDTEKGKKQAADSIPFYNGKEGLTLTAREERSFEIMKSLYPDTDIHLMPDIVLSSSAEEFGIRQHERRGVLMCLRNDAEKSISDEFWRELRERINVPEESIRVIDMEAGRIILDVSRAKIVRNKMQEFRNAGLVITDRLHGMVFAALTGTPCVVFSNNNHKVKSTYDWISYLPYIRYAET